MIYLLTRPVAAFRDSGENVTKPHARGDSMTEEQTPLWAGASASVGGFLSAVLPSHWPWYLDLAVVVVGGVVVYGIAKAYARKTEALTA